MEAYGPILGQPTPVEPTKYSRDGWQIVRSHATGLLFLANPPEYGQLVDEFAFEATARQEAERRKREEPIVFRLSWTARRLKARLSLKKNRIYALARTMLPVRPEGEPRRFLDVGCGNGKVVRGLVDAFAAAGQAVIPVGIEVSRGLAERAAKHFEQAGGELIFANAMDGAKQLAPGTIDVVILRSFLEHEARPLELLRALAPAIADDGVVIIKVPNFGCWNRSIRGRRWCGFRFPDHVNYFTPRTLRLLAERAGYVVARQNFFDKFPANDSMYAVLRKQTVGRDALESPKIHRRGA